MQTIPFTCPSGPGMFGFLGYLLLFLSRTHFLINQNAENGPEFPIIYEILAWRA